MIRMFLLPAGLLLIGTADLPIGYYTFLRIVVFISSSMIANGSYYREKNNNKGAVLFGVIALFFEVGRKDLDRRRHRNVLKSFPAVMTPTW